MTERGLVVKINQFGVGGDWLDRLFDRLDGRFLPRFVENSLTSRVFNLGLPPLFQERNEITVNGDTIYLDYVLEKDLKSRTGGVFEARDNVVAHGFEVNFAFNNLFPSRRRAVLNFAAVLLDAYAQMPYESDLPRERHEFFAFARTKTEGNQARKELLEDLGFEKKAVEKDEEVWVLNAEKLAQEYPSLVPKYEGDFWQELCAGKTKLGNKEGEVEHYFIGETAKFAFKVEKEGKERVYEMKFKSDYAMVDTDDLRNALWGLNEIVKKDHLGKGHQVYVEIWRGEDYLPRQLQRLGFEKAKKTKEKDIFHRYVLDLDKFTPAWSALAN